MFFINKNTILHTILIALAFEWTKVSLQDIEEKEVIWSPCDDKDFKSPFLAKDVKVFVPQCPPVNGSETKCKLTKGIDATLKIQFKTTEPITDIERVIVARVPVAGNLVEMPYGPSISPCENSSTVATDGSECVNNGVVPDKYYTYTSLFKVLKSFPTVSDITTKIIVRKKLPEHKKIRLYKKHPGPHLLCAKIPNIEVVE